MKKITLIVLSIFTMAITKAQTTNQPEKPKVHFGVKGGLNMASLSFSSDLFGNNEKSDSKYKAGAYLAGFIEFPFSEKLYGEVGVQFVDNGASFEEKVLGQTNKLEISIAQLNLPLLLKFEVAKGLRLKGGAYIGKLLSAKFTFNGNDSDEGKIKDNFDYGASLGAEYVFNGGFLLEANYNYGMANISKVDKVTVKNQFFQVGLGYRF